MPTLRYLHRSLTVAAIVAELDHVDRAALTPAGRVSYDIFRRRFASCR